MKIDWTRFCIGLESFFLYLNQKIRTKQDNIQQEKTDLSLSDIGVIED